METILSINNLTKKFGYLTAVKDLSFTIKKGNVYGILGPNGSGKSTTLGIVLNVVNKTSGNFSWFEGQTTTHDALKKVGAIIENPNFYPYMTAYDNLKLVCKIKGVDYGKIDEKLGLVGLLDRKNSKFSNFSLGMKQRLGIAMALLNDPELLILDEPFSGFDPVNANLIKDEILELNRKGTSIIFSTHRMESVEEMCDHIALIHKSNKLIEGKLSDVKKQFRTNNYDVGILTNNVEGLMYDLTQKYTIAQTDFKSLNDELKLEINLGNATPNELLNTLIQRGQVTHFMEKIPSVNDIFIKTVTE